MKSGLHLVAAIVAAAAGTASAQSTVIFTDVGDGFGTNGSFVKSVTIPNVVSTHVAFGPGEGRFSDIKPSPTGYVFGDGPFPPGNDPNFGTGKIWNVTDLFTTPAVTQVDAPGSSWNPIGVRYDGPSNTVLTMDNLAGGFFDGVVDRAFRGVNYSTGVNNRLMKERVAIPGTGNQTGEGRPWHEGGAYMTPDPQGSNNYYVISTTGGRFVGPFTGDPNRNVSSMIWRVTTDGVTDGTGTNTGTVFRELIDTADAAFPRSTDPVTNFNFTDFRGLTSKPGSNSLFVTTTFYDSIWRIDLTGAGAFAGATMILGNLDAPEAIEYDPFTDTLVFAELGSKTLNRINLDGTNRIILARDVHVRGITFIPTPGGLAVLGLGAMALIRRRR